ncbi:MAG: hypothetical protein FWH12_00475 [Treponema sp.]|nr:hypothetical protein [Treponema sp.]
MAKQWYQENLRFMQTVLRECDIIDYDAAALVNYMKEAGANTLVVNAGGVIDFFPYPSEMGNLNKFYKDEILPGICAEIRQAGMRVILRVDFRGVEPRRYQKHPDWFSLDQHGKPRIGTAYRGTVVHRPCYNSYYTNEHAESFIDYLMRTYDIDGIWQNSLGFDAGPCYCKRCKKLYREATGKEIPTLREGEGPSALEGPLFAEYRAWKIIQADRHIERMRGAVKKYGEDKAYCAEIFDLYNDSFSRSTGIDHSNAKKSFDFIVSCVFLGRGGGAGSRIWDVIHNSATTIRFSRALDPKKQPVLVTGGNGTRWRYVKDPSLESRLWMWQIASVGGGIWNCYFNGQHPAQTHDRRNAYIEKDVYSYLAKHSSLISDTIPSMDVAIFYSGATKDRLLRGDEQADDYGLYIRGIERVLLENHIQYGFVSDLDLSPEKLRGVKALLLPNTAYLSDRDIKIIQDYVAQGGGLLASRKAGLFDERGQEREDLGFKDLLGISYTGQEIDTSYDTFQLIRDKANPVFKDLGDTDMLMNGGTSVLVSLEREDYKAAATHIPMIHNQPPEYAYIPDMETDYPTIVTGEYGQGRIVYFSFPMEALCFYNGHEDFTEVYKNALDYATGSDYLIEARAPRTVHVNMIESQGDANHLVIALVNSTGSAQRPMKEIVPVEVELRVPLRGRKLVRSQVLWGEGLEIKSAPGEVCITMKALGEFASFELQLK